MPNQIDPTYLRYVYDGLVQGQISADNAADLPHGLVGLYEELFPASMPVAERQHLLERFCVWALMRREVSTALMAGLWKQSEEEVMEFIRNHSRWFVSPKQGLYRLYHDKLRTFYLQRLAPSDVSKLNQNIISYLQQVLKQQKGTDATSYALQYLAHHLYVEAMQHPGHGKQLLKLSHDTALWQRQLNQSKSYSWTKEMLQNARHWAAQHSEQDLEECALQQIDLYYMEQNSAPQVVELVKQNDMEAALARIQSFGENDEEGLRRKFTLYMLCLMELTLLESKNQAWAREAAEKLLRHFDDNLPVNHSILNWNDFFPSYLVFQMACRLAEQELDYQPIYQRTDTWESDWISEQGPYTQLQFDFLLTCTNGISDNRTKIKALSSISTELSKQGKLEETGATIQETLSCANGISNNSEKSKALASISTELSKQGKVEEAAAAIQEALSCASGIWNTFGKKSKVLASISTELSKQGEVEEAAAAIQEALSCASGISNNRTKSEALSSISTELSKQGKLEEALEEASGISDNWEKSEALASISTELSKQGKVEEALSCVSGISNNRTKSEALASISTELLKQGKLEEAGATIQEALSCANGISNDWEKSNTLASISTELSKQGKLEEALSCANGISNWTKSRALASISTELSKQGKLEEAGATIQEALSCASGISNWKKSYTLASISTELFKQGKVEEALSCTNGISDDNEKSKALSSISIELSKLGKLEEALSCANGISDNDEKSRALASISTELSKQGKLEEALSCASGISDNDEKSRALASISTELSKQGKLEEAGATIQEALSCANGISDERKKSEALSSISTELSKLGKLEEALSCASGICDEGEKSEALASISTELFKQGKLEEAGATIQEALSCANGISNWKKSYTLASICTELSKQGKVEEALSCANGISDNDEKSRTLASISTELSKQGKLEQAGATIQEALSCANGISDNWEKSEALASISTELSKQGKVEEALSCTNGISEEYYKNKALSSISTELSKQEKWHLAEATAKEIPQQGTRQDCWQQIGEDAYHKMGYKQALEVLQEFTNSEAREFILKGITQSLKVDNITKEDALLALRLPTQEVASMEHVMQMHVIHQLFFEDLPSEKLQRYNSTLNLQWAIDIKEQVQRF